MIIAPEFEYLAFNNKSFIRNLSPFTKFSMFVIYLSLNLFLKLPYYGIFCIFVFLVLLISKVSLKHILKPLLLSIFTGFLIFIAKLHFLKNGVPFKFIIDFYPASFSLAVTGGLRIVLGVVLMMVFIGTTPLNDFLTLMTKLKVPDIFVEIFLIIYKFIFILNDESQRMKNAQMVRLGYKNFRNSLESFGNLIGMIVIRGFNKGSKMSEALYVRGYNGRLFYPSSIVKPKAFEYLIILFMGILPLIFGVINV